MREEVQILQTPKHSVTSSSCHLWLQYKHILLQSYNECHAFQEALPSGPGASLLVWHLLCKATSFTQIFAQTASFLRILPVCLICKEETLLPPFYLAFLLPILLVLNHFFSKKVCIRKAEKKPSVYSILLQRISTWLCQIKRAAKKSVLVFGMEA